MKRSRVIAAAFAALVVLSGLPVWAATRMVTLAVPGMECGGCPLTVRTSLQRLRGVRVVAVDTSARTITVAVSDERVTDRQLTMATANAGYPSSVVRKATATSSKASR